MRTNNASRPAEHKKDHLEREERREPLCIVMQQWVSQILR